VVWHARTRRRNHYHHRASRIGPHRWVVMVEWEVHRSMLTDGHGGIAVVRGGVLVIFSHDSARRRRLQPHGTLGYLYQEKRRQDAPERYGHGERTLGGTPTRFATAVSSLWALTWVRTTRLAG
jgi:hypothetical protein